MNTDDNRNPDEDNREDNREPEREPECEPEHKRRNITENIETSEVISMEIDELEQPEQPEQLEQQEFNLSSLGKINGYTASSVGMNIETDMIVIASYCSKYLKAQKKVLEEKFQKVAFGQLIDGMTQDDLETVLAYIPQRLEEITQDLEILETIGRERHVSSNNINALNRIYPPIYTECLELGREALRREEELIQNLRNQRNQRNHLQQGAQGQYNVDGVNSGNQAVDNGGDEDGDSIDEDEDEDEIPPLEDDVGAGDLVNQLQNLLGYFGRIDGMNPRNPDEQAQPHPQPQIGNAGDARINDMFRGFDLGGGVQGGVVRIPLGGGLGGGGLGALNNIFGNMGNLGQLGQMEDIKVPLKISVIEQMPMTKYNSIYKDGECDTCPVCLTDISEGEIVRKMTLCCNKFIHKDCTYQWWDTQHTCASCGKNLHDLDQPAPLSSGSEIN